MDVLKATRCDICATNEKYKSENIGIYVTGLPSRVNEKELRSFFSQFDEIDELYFPESGQYCLVKFLLRRITYNDMINNRIVMFGKDLTIKLRKYADGRRENSYPGVPSPENIHSALCEEPCLRSQVDKLIHLLEPRSDAQANYNLVCYDLAQTLNHISSSYKVMPFGSSVNGLAYKGSDLDVFYGLEPFAGINPVQNVFRKAKDAIIKSKLFSMVQPIAGARVPIIKFVHDKTGIHCDLSFRNTLGVQNSKLVKFLTSVDDRIRPFLMIVKYWAKLHGVTGRQFSNYALTLLLINFLQTLDDPILPPIAELQHSELKPIIVDSWNANFDCDITRLKPISNNLPLNEILSRFFECTAYGNFHDYVLCPIVGRAIHKSLFDNSAGLPSEMTQFLVKSKSLRDHLKLHPPLSIQDPLELNLNVSQNMGQSAYYSLKEHCAIAAKICKGPQHLILPNLLSFTFVVPPSPNCSTFKSEYSRPYQVSFSVSIEDANFFGEKKLLERIQYVLQEVLFIRVHCLSQKLLCKSNCIVWQSRDRLWEDLCLREQSETKADEDEVQVVYHKVCKRGSNSAQLNPRKRNISQVSEQSTENVQKRPRLNMEHSNASSSYRSLQDEIELSKAMLRSGRGRSAKDIILNFECFLVKQGTSITIELIDKGSRINYFSSLCEYLHKNLPQWMLK